ncbi:glycosyltransferase family 4 protein [Candidatus Roizmanbacteria bacterium]|nr:glycosyltransferase family 4 protein [Candidatus Roizmanbacteria bacterium]
MSKIGIDARLYSQTGVGVYIRNLLHYLDKKNFGDIVVYIYLLKADYDKVVFHNRQFIKRKLSFRWHTLSEQLGFLATLYRDDLDLVHFTYFSYPIFYRKRFVATVHDMTPLLFKTGRASTKNPIIYELKFNAFRISLQEQVKNASVLITPSKAVREQILEVFDRSLEKKIIPLYEGINYELLETSENRLLEKEFPGKFFIYVGNFYPHKNVHNLLLAFAKLTTNMKLVLVGPKDFFSTKIMSLIRVNNLTEKVTLYTDPTVQDLIFFYKKATALVNPSLSEGFGLPLVEAGYFKLPIIASDIEVFREICKNNFMAFDPNDTNDIAQKLDLFQHERRHLLLTEVEKRFSFERMTNEVYNIYRTVI